MRDVIAAELGVAFNAAVVSLVGYGLYALLTAASFDFVVWAKVAGALFVVTNVAFIIAKWREGTAWHVARAVTDRGDD